jgi:NADH dehydrogenase
MFLHLMLILSVKNKIIIFINWAWNYFTKDTSLRLIFAPKKSLETYSKDTIDTNVQKNSTIEK